MYYLLFPPEKELGDTSSISLVSKPFLSATHFATQLSSGGTKLGLKPHQWKHSRLMQQL